MNEHPQEVPSWVRRLVPGLLVLLMVFLLLLPPGENVGGDHRGYWDEARQEYVVVEESQAFGATTGRIMGQFTFHFLLMSLLFAYRRPLGDRIGQALRTRFHRGLGITILVLALLHGGILLLDAVYRGWLTGLVSFGVLILHGTLGFAKPWFLRRLGTATWRYVHISSAWAGLLIGLQHALFYGQHYGLFRELFFGQVS